MTFFFNDTKKAEAAKPKAAPRARDIPVHLLGQIGCSACTHNNDEVGKLTPSGDKRPAVYVLMPSVTDACLDAELSGSDVAAREINKLLPREIKQMGVRWGALTQCAENTSQVNQHAVACCRPRVVADIEASKPAVIVGVGDAPLAWATALSAGKASALTFRGSKFPVKIGAHTCWFYSVLYPNYAFKTEKKRKETNTFELATRHDLTNLADIIDAEPAFVYERNLDAGIEVLGNGDSADLESLELALTKLASEPDVAVDLETTRLSPFFANSKLLTASVGTFDHVVAFPLDHPEGWQSERLRRRAWELLAEFLLNSGAKVAHNLGFEQEWLAHFVDKRVVRLTEWEDTMAMAHTLDERPGTKSLEVQTCMHFGFNLKALSSLDTADLLKYPLRQVLKYNALDSKWTHKLAAVLREKINAVPEYMWQYEHKMRMVSTLVLTQAKGLPVDFDYMRAQQGRLRDETESLEKRLRAFPEVKTFESRFRRRFNPAAPQDVLGLLRDVCQRDELRVEDSRTGAVSFTTSEDVLSTIPASEVPSASAILELRQAEKLLGTYVEPVMSRQIVAADDRVHCRYGLMTAVTNRLASEEPNLQNFPKRKNKEIRGFVKDPDGKWFVACDYGQIEFRVAGMCSEDEELVKACWTGYDVHKFWAERMVALYPEIKDWIVDEFKIDWDEKGLKTLRQESKNKWVFPCLFGAGTYSRAQSLHLPQDIAEELDAEFWDTFRGVKKWQDKLITKYERDLYVETLGGHRRRGMMTRNEIINTPIQGTAAEVVKEGMAAVSERALILGDDDLHPSLNVHDDLSYLIDDDKLEGHIDIITYEMTKPRFDWINVPLLVEVSIGERWHELKEIGVYSSEKIHGIRNPFK